MNRTPPKAGPPHPNVAKLKTQLLSVPPGGDISYQILEAEIGEPVQTPARGYRWLRSATRILCKEDGINIVVVPGQGCHRQTSPESLQRQQQSGRRGLRRKAKRQGEALANVATHELNTDQLAEYCAERAIVALAYTATGGRAKTKLLAAAKVSPTQLPMAKALEILKEGNGKG